jgi:TolB-like protein
MPIALFLGLSVANAETVAVLPLEQGAGSETYAGLGKALAGMLVTDLSKVEGLTLVERSRLDAVMDELKLGESAFVDPATAQKLGKGLGAELVVVGDYSVVGDTFLMSARLVKVESGEVKKAADASGTVADFVGVEKAVVKGLLDQVAAPEAARKPALETSATESFEALQAYGQGLDAQDAGKVEDAKRAFAEAVRADPEFGLAKSELGALRQAIEAQLAERKRQKDAARAAILDKVLAEVPGPDRLPAGKWSADDVVGLALRWEVQEELGQHCTRAAEMRAYLDKVGWKPKYPGKDYQGTVAAIVDRGVAFGMFASEKESPSRHRDAEFRVQTGSAPLFTDVGSFLYRFPCLDLDVDGAFDYLHATKACLEPPEWPAAVAEIREQVVARGLSDVTNQSYSDVKLAERLELTGYLLRAEVGGVDEEVRKGWEAAVERHVGNAETHQWLLMTGEKLVQKGWLYERRRAALAGMTEGQIDGIIDAVAAKDAAKLDLANPVCAGLVDMNQRWAEALRDNRAERADRWIPSESGASGFAAPLRDMGCVIGSKGRFQHPGQAHAWIAAAKSRMRPENEKACADAWKALPQQVANVPADGNWQSWQLSPLLTWYYGSLVFPLCVTE